MTSLRIVRVAQCGAIFAAVLVVAVAGCQSQPPSPTPAASAPATVKAPPPAAAAPAAQAPQAEAERLANAGPLAPLAWLAGCWKGTVNQREFREQWLPLRGGMLVGAGQQTSGGRMQDYEFLRIEARVDGIRFSQYSGDRKEISFRLASTMTDDKDTIFTFANTAGAFPARLIYRRGTGGWLYETIEGRLDGSDRKVIYPLRRVDCESDELILQ